MLDTVAQMIIMSNMNRMDFPRDRVTSTISRGSTGRFPMHKTRKWRGSYAAKSPDKGSYAETIVRQKLDFLLGSFIKLGI